MVELDIDDCKKGMQGLSFSVIIHVSLQKGATLPTNQLLKKKLLEERKISTYKDVPYDKVLYHIVLLLMQDQAATMIHIVVNLQPWIIRVHRWYPGFSLTNHKQTSVQVWVQIFVSSSRV